MLPDFEGSTWSVPISPSLLRAIQEGGDLSMIMKQVFNTAGAVFFLMLKVGKGIVVHSTVLDLLHLVLWYLWNSSIMPNVGHVCESSKI